MKIQRVHGNIGQPGVSFLVPPPEPVIQKPDIGNWSVLNYSPFRGECENNFSETSIHLRLTVYELPLSGMQDKHFIDRPARILEALAQVYDGPKWVADLDILGSLDQIHSLRCKHGSSDPRFAYSQIFREADKLVSVDNWDELLTEKNQQEVYVVRSSDNWLGRLATACVSVQLGHKVSAFPQDVCWRCMRIVVDEGSGVLVL